MAPVAEHLERAFRSKLRARILGVMPKSARCATSNLISTFIEERVGAMIGRRRAPRASVLRRVHALLSSWEELAMALLFDNTSQLAEDKVSLLIDKLFPPVPRSDQWRDVAIYLATNRSNFFTLEIGDVISRTCFDLRRSLPPISPAYVAIRTGSQSFPSFSFFVGGGDLGMGRCLFPPCSSLRG